MNEKELEMLLADYLGNELDDAERRRFEEFLDANPQARAEVEALRRTLADVRCLEEETESRVAEWSGSRESCRAGWFTTALRYAAVLAVGMGVGWLLKPAEVGPGKHETVEPSPAPQVAVTEPVHPDWIRAVATASRTHGQGSSFACHMAILAAMKRDG